jgi:SAM-dependent methyltransferase
MGIEAIVAPLAMTPQRRVAYHEMMGILGVGDLHPGGHLATEFLLGHLARAKPAHVLEIGAGRGKTTERMMKRGWRVTPIEPSVVLCEALKARLRIPAHVGTFETFDETGGPYDAAIGEGVLYRLDPDATVTKLARLLPPGGLLAFGDMTWTDAAQKDVVAFLHDQTKEAFGIPMAPREVVSLTTWKSALERHGFVEIETRTIPRAEFSPDPKGQRAQVALGLLRRPDLIPLFLRYRALCQIPWAPQGWLESWMSVWKRS